MSGQAAREVGPSLPATVAWQVAAAAGLNADAYYAQARLLNRHGWHGRACALAILGQEEAGKAAYFWCVAIGALEMKPDSLKEMFRKHVWKQRFSRITAGLVDYARRHGTELAVCLKDAIEPAVSVGEPSDRAEVRAAVASRLDACAKEREVAIRALIEPLRAAFEEIEDYSGQDPKHAGLYVGLEGARISAPSEVQRAVAIREIAVLRLSRMVSKRLMTGFDENDAAMLSSAPLFPHTETQTGH